MTVTTGLYSIQQNLNSILILFNNYLKTQVLLKSVMDVDLV